MNVLLMGAGYVGLAFLSALQKHPLDGHISVTTTSQERIKELETLADSVIFLESPSQAALAVALESADALVISIAPKQGSTYKETYVDSATFICSILKQRQKPLHITYISSTSVYSGIDTNEATEDLCLAPSSESSKILHEAENLYLSLPFEVCIFRLGGIYGPNRTLESRARMLSGRQMPTMGSEPTNHIHLSDIVSALTFSLEHSLSGIYNLVGDWHPSKKTLYTSLCKSLGIKEPQWSLKSDLGYRVSNQKIKDKGFVFEHSGMPSEIKACLNTFGIDEP